MNARNFLQRASLRGLHVFVELLRYRIALTDHGQKFQDLFLCQLLLWNWLPWLQALVIVLIHLPLQSQNTLETNINCYLLPAH